MSEEAGSTHQQTIVDALGLADEARLSAASRSSIAKILSSGLDIAEMAIARAAEQMDLTQPEVPPQLAMPLDLFPETAMPLGHGWMTKKGSGDYWFNKVASLIVPHSLPKGTSIIVEGTGRCKWSAPRHFSVRLDQVAVPGKLRWVLPGNWRFIATLTTDISPRRPAVLMQLLCAIRGDLTGLISPDLTGSDTASKQCASLGISQVRLLPPSAH